MTDLLQHGLVSHDSDEELDVRKARRGGLREKTTACDAELAAADGGEEGGDVLPGELDGGEILEYLFELAGLESKWVRGYCELRGCCAGAWWYSRRTRL